MVLRSQVFQLFFMRCPSGQELPSIASKGFEASGLLQAVQHQALLHPR